MPYSRPQYSASLLVVPYGSDPLPVMTWGWGVEGCMAAVEGPVKR
jgi:hypothetical protein